MKAYVKPHSGNTITKKSPIQGFIPAYWTRQGVTAFFFDGKDDSLVQKDDSMVPAVPGMVGTDLRGNYLWLVLADGEVIKIKENKEND